MYTIEQWINEMDLSSADKRKRIRLGHIIDNRMRSFFQRQLRDMLGGYFLSAYDYNDYEYELMYYYLLFFDADRISAESWENLISREEIIESRYNELASQSDSWENGRADRWSSEILNTTMNAIERANSETLNNAIQNGLPISESDIPLDVMNVLSDERATEIAMNETNVISNYLRHLELRETQITHTWLTMRDEKVRPQHAEADGQTTFIDVPFTVMGEQLMFPGDDSLGASPDNLIFCRCTEI